MSTAGVDKDYMGSKMTEHVSILWKRFFATDAANKQARVFAPVQAFWAYCNICTPKLKTLHANIRLRSILVSNRQALCFPHTVSGKERSFIISKPKGLSQEIEQGQEAFEDQAEDQEGQEGQAGVNMFQPFFVIADNGEK